MRVAYVCADPGVPVFGRKGCSIHVQEVVRAMTRLGCDVDLFATRFDADPPVDLRNVQLHKLPQLPQGELSEREWAAIEANKDLQASLKCAGPFDLVYERYSLWSFAGMEMARSARISGILEVNAPLIEEQATYRGLQDRAAAEGVAHHVFFNASNIVAVSDQVADYLGEFDSLSRKIAVIPNGVDVQRFSPSRRPTSPSPPGVTTIGFVGTLKPWHGVDVLIAAAEQLIRQERSIRLLIVGDGPEATALLQDVQSRQLDSVVEFTGSVAPDDIPALLTSMDIAIAPYPPRPNFYFSPLKIVEYMASGRAIIASRIGQMMDILDNGVTAMHCQPGDVAQLASIIDQLIDNPTKRQQLGREARLAAVRRHSWDSVVRRILHLADLAAPRQLECVS